jgi:uncharacterized protein DUF6139
MRMDIYRRPEADNKFTYLAVPEGRPIPQEAINTDWECVARGAEKNENAQQLAEYGIDQPQQQIDEKGYAITSVTHMVDGTA